MGCVEHRIIQVCIRKMNYLNTLKINSYCKQCGGLIKKGTGDFYSRKFCCLYHKNKYKQYGKSNR